MGLSLPHHIPAWPDNVLTFLPSGNFSMFHRLLRVFLSSFIQASPLPLFPNFILLGMHQCWTWKKWCLNINQISWVFLPSNAITHWIIPVRSSKRSKLVVRMSRVAVLHIAISSMQDLELRYPMVTVTKAGPSLHTPS